MIEALKSLDWLSLGNAILVLAAAIVALTPTEKDDNVVARIKNVFAKYLGK